MLGKIKIISVKSPTIFYKFHINDPVKIINGYKINDSIILSRYSVNGVNYYKVGNINNNVVCEEKHLINR